MHGTALLYVFSGLFGSPEGTAFLLGEPESQAVAPLSLERQRLATFWIVGTSLRNASFSLCSSIGSEPACGRLTTVVLSSGDDEAFHQGQELSTRGRPTEDQAVKRGQAPDLPCHEQKNRSAPTHATEAFGKRSRLCATADGSKGSREATGRFCAGPLPTLRAKPAAGPR